MKNKKIKILMLLESPFPPDIRVEKEVKTLIQNGFNVSLLCEKHKDSSKNIENWHGMKIYRSDMNTTFTSKLLNQIFVINKIVKNELIELIKKENFKVIHVHDLKLVKTALEVKRILPNIKVVADLHENYPAAVDQWMKIIDGPKGIFLRLCNSYKKWFNIEKEIVHKVDKIIAVVDEMKDRIIATHGISKNKIIVVSNLEEKDFVQKANLNQNILDRYRGYFTVLYIGGFGVHRGLDTAIQGMKYIDKKNIRLLLVGKGSDSIEKYFQKIIKENNLEEKVEIVGWQPFEKVYTYQYLSDVCIIPHNSNEHTDNTIPHKIYQYMMVGKPIIVSSCPPIARITNDAKSGLVFKAGDSKDFAKQILEFYNNRELSASCAKNGIRYTFEEGNNWDNEGNKLAKLYETMI